MKKILCLLAAGIVTFQAFSQQSEDKTKRPSPPAKVTQEIGSGATITIQYSQPSVKGRTIGKDIDPMEGIIWRTGANEATTFTTDKELHIQDAVLPAGKYGLFTIWTGNDVTIIFNKTWEQWGAFNYKMEEDQLRIKAMAVENSPVTEKLTFTISPSGLVTLLWGPKKVSFTVE